jgi:hypothetical protein
MDLWLKTGTLKRELNNENETNFNIQQFVEEAVSYSPLPTNVSSNCAAQGTQTECNVLKTVTINNVKIRKYFDNYLSVGFTQDGHGNSPRRVCVLCNEVLEITSVALSNLHHHFKTNHHKHKHKHKPLSFSDVY